jgi:hypothetical protein
MVLKDLVGRLPCMLPLLIIVHNFRLLVSLTSTFLILRFAASFVGQGGFVLYSEHFGI